MHGNYVKVIKDDVKVSTNGKCVDICVTPENQSGKDAQVITVTIKLSTAGHLRDALEAYFTLDSTM